MIHLIKTFAFANTPPKPEQILLSTSQMATLLGISRTTTWRYIKQFSDFPKPYYFGKNTKRWLKEDVLTWVNNRRKGG